MTSRAKPSVEDRNNEPGARFLVRVRPFNTDFQPLRGCKMHGFQSLFIRCNKQLISETQSSELRTSNFPSSMSECMIFSVREPRSKLLPRLHLVVEPAAPYSFPCTGAFVPAPPVPRKS
jgi:hypothetical protein